MHHKSTMSTKTCHQDAMLMLMVLLFITVCIFLLLYMTVDHVVAQTAGLKPAMAQRQCVASPWPPPAVPSASRTRPVDVACGWGTREGLADA